MGAIGSRIRPSSSPAVPEVGRETSQRSVLASSPAAPVEASWFSPPASPSWTDREPRPLAAIQRKAIHSPLAAAPASGGALQRGLAAQGQGQHLPQGLSSQMAHSFGTSFEDIRVHQDPAASAVGARALTHGSDLHFAPGEYQPDTHHGRELIGHELTHVVQQRQGRVAAPQGSGATGITEDAALEAEADRAGAHAARGERVEVRGATAGGTGAPTGVQLKKREGSVQVGAATQAGDYAYEGDENSYFTQQILESAAGPRASVDQALDKAADSRIDLGDKSQAPASFKSGGAANPTADQPGEAVYVANSQYEKVSRLSKPPKDAERMKSTMEAKGFKGVVHQDLKADALEKTFSEPLLSKTPNPHILLYFSGHGLQEGIAGTDADEASRKGIVPHGKLVGLTDRAQSAGVHLKIVLDACHSGALVDAVRQSYFNKLEKELGGDGAKKVILDDVRLLHRVLADVGPTSLVKPAAGGKGTGGGNAPAKGIEVEDASRRYPSRSLVTTSVPQFGGLNERYTLHFPKKAPLGLPTSVDDLEKIERAALAATLRRGADDLLSLLDGG